MRVYVCAHLAEVADSPAAAKLQKKLAERRNKCIELQETEINYVAILNYIVKVCIMQTLETG